MGHLSQNVSRDEIYQAFSLLFILQVTQKLGVETLERGYVLCTL